MSGPPNKGDLPDLDTPNLACVDSGGMEVPACCLKNAPSDPLDTPNWTCPVSGHRWRLRTSYRWTDSKLGVFGEGPEWAWELVEGLEASGSGLTNGVSYLATH